MTNNILLTINYKKDFHQCVSTTHSLMNQTVESEILSIFPNSQHKDFYESYFKQYKSSLVKFISNHNNSFLIDQIYHQYLPKYSWFAFLSPYVLYNRNFIEELQTLCSKNNDKQILNIFAHNDPDRIFKGVIYSTNVIINSIKNNYNIQNLFEEEFDSNDQKNLTCFNCLCWKDIEQEYLSKQTPYHNDEYSIFVKFIETNNSNLKDSFVYINKPKNRIYNIANNIIGIIEEYDNNKIKVLWSMTDGAQINAKYEFNYNTKSYTKI